MVLVWWVKVQLLTLSSPDKWLACQSMDNQIMIYGVHTNFRLNRKKNFRGHMVTFLSSSSFPPLLPPSFSASLRLSLPFSLPTSLPSLLPSYFINSNSLAGCWLCLHS